MFFGFDLLLKQILSSDSEVQSEFEHVKMNQTTNQRQALSWLIIIQSLIAWSFKLAIFYNLQATNLMVSLFYVLDVASYFKAIRGSC